MDFSASISPIGPPAGVWEAIRKVDLSAYPDPQCQEFKQVLATHVSGPGNKSEKIAPRHLLVGNGSTEIIHLLARAYLPAAVAGANHGAFILTPTYGEYAGACRIQGVPVFSFDVGPPPGFRWDMDQAAQAIESRRPALVFLCNPNNPTGVLSHVR